jgi:hypothetical protein
MVTEEVGGMGRHPLLAISPALAVCALAELLILPFKLVGGCGPLPPPWWAYAPVVALLPFAVLGIVVGHLRWNLGRFPLALGVGLFAVSVAIVLMPELNVVSIITTC